MAYSQVSGGQVYGNQNSYSSNIKEFNNQRYLMYLSDSSFLIQAKVLKNVTADYYIAVFGIDQSNTDVKTATEMINRRISNFLKNLQTLDIKEDDIYIDMINQNRIYDIRKKGNDFLEEYLIGFETKRNVIVKYKKANLIEKMMVLAAKDSIFDLVKVDYVVENQDKIYDELFAEASKIIQKKKEMIIQLTNSKLLPYSQIYGESFETIYPTHRYKSYAAYSSSEYNLPYNSNYAVKNQRKTETFYYDKVSNSGYDKILNDNQLEPTVQFSFLLQVKYELSKK
jgi:uncharacterized protein YggE